MENSTQRPLKGKPKNPEPREHLIPKKYIQELMPQQSVEEDQEIPIFTKQFGVDALEDPIKFLPNYRERENQQRSFVEVCLTCHGVCCMKLGFLGALCCSKCCCVYQLESSYAGLVETFGKFSRMLKPGFNLINPCTDEVALVDLKIMNLKAGRHVVITKDNVNLTVEASIAFRVVNPVIAHYVLGNQTNHALTQLTVSSLRNIIGIYPLDEVLQSRKKIVTETKEQIMKNIPPGIYVDRIFVEEIQVPRQVERDLSSVAKQKRISQANIIQTKGDVESAKLMKESAQLLDTKAAMQIRYLEMVEDLSARSVTMIMQIGVHKKGYKQQE